MFKQWSGGRYIRSNLAMPYRPKQREPIRVQCRPEVMEVSEDPRPPMDVQADGQVVVGRCDENPLTLSPPAQDGAGALGGPVNTRCLF